jgi:hypothetical protein
MHCAKKFDLCHACGFDLVGQGAAEAGTSNKTVKPEKTGLPAASII